VQQPPARRTWREAATPPQPLPDPDELSAGNAGFENYTPPTAEERAEYCRGWRTGVGHGLVGGALMGAVAALCAVWLGVQFGLGAM
jgi:hypothetical protein